MKEVVSPNKLGTRGFASFLREVTRIISRKDQN